MGWKWRHPALLGAVFAACALAGCNDNGSQQALIGQPRGATVAFESIDGPPQAQFNTLVQDLNEEAQSRRLAVTSREQPSAYRVRGYLSAETNKKATTISWVWDVFDREQNRSLRISGTETVKGRHRDAWQVVDDVMLRRIAANSMSELAAFLTSAEVAPGTPDAAPAIALAEPSGSSPEAAGIFRVFHASVDPAPVADASLAGNAGAVPLPRRRPIAANAPGVTVAAAR